MRLPPAVHSDLIHDALYAICRSCDGDESQIEDRHVGNPPQRRYTIEDTDVGLSFGNPLVESFQTLLCRSTDLVLPLQVIHQSKTDPVQDYEEYSMWIRSREGARLEKGVRLGQTDSFHLRIDLLLSGDVHSPFRSVARATHLSEFLKNPPDHLPVTPTGPLLYLAPEDHRNHPSSPTRIQILILISTIQHLAHPPTPPSRPPPTQSQTPLL